MNQEKIKVLKEFKLKFVADDVLDCIPEKNWTEMKDEVERFFSNVLSRQKEEFKRVVVEMDWDLRDNTRWVEQIEILKAIEKL